MNKDVAVTIVVNAGKRLHTHSCYTKPAALQNKDLFIVEVTQPCKDHIGTEYVRSLNKEGIDWIFGHFPDDSIEAKALLVARALSD